MKRRLGSLGFLRFLECLGWIGDCGTIDFGEQFGNQRIADPRSDVSQHSVKFQNINFGKSVGFSVQKIGKSVVLIVVKLEKVLFWQGQKLEKV